MGRRGVKYRFCPERKPRDEPAMQSCASRRPVQRRQLAPGETAWESASIRHPPASRSAPAASSNGCPLQCTWACRTSSRARTCRASRDPKPTSEISPDTFRMMLRERRSSGRDRPSTDLPVLRLQESAGVRCGEPMDYEVTFGRHRGGQGGVHAQGRGAGDETVPVLQEDLGARRATSARTSRSPRASPSCDRGVHRHRRGNGVVRAGGFQGPDEKFVTENAPPTTRSSSTWCATWRGS